jgi:hypothetical protein
VLLLTHTAAYAWAIWDGDWLRGRPVFWQAPITGLLLILLSLLHPNDLRPDAGSSLTLYYALSGFVVLSTSAVIFSYRKDEKNLSTDEH